MRWIFISQLYNPLDEFLLVEPCVHAVFGQAGVERADGVAACARKGIRVGVAEEDFEGAGRHKDELGRMKDKKTTHLQQDAPF